MMNGAQAQGRSVRTAKRSRLFVLIGCGGLLTTEILLAQSRESLAGEKAAEALKSSLEAEIKECNLRYGPLRFKAGANLGVSYTDNIFYSHDRSEDFVINPEIALAALWPITDRNALRLSLNVGYELYLKHSELNGDAPLVNPGSEVAFHLFVGAFHIRLHERFSYQESLFFNSFSGENVRFYNFNDVGKFSRFNNEVGFQAEGDLNKLVLSFGYNHENFVPMTRSFDYLDRASEWFTGSAGFSIGDKAQTGMEAQASLHDYAQETFLSDSWKARVGPFLDIKSEGKISVRAGAGFDTAQYDTASENSDYETYYAYVRAGQETRLFSHYLTLGREHLLGANANNLKTTYARYTISSPVVAHINLEGNLSVNLAEEFGGPFHEEFTYYGAGFRVRSQFHKFWRVELGYEFLLKESDLPARDFQRNRVTVLAGYTF
jgi:hypothetical protein